GVGAVRPVAVQVLEVRAEAGDVVERVRAVRVPGELDRLPDLRGVLGRVLEAVDDAPDEAPTAARTGVHSDFPLPLVTRSTMRRGIAGIACATPWATRAARSAPSWAHCSGRGCAPDAPRRSRIALRRPSRSGSSLRSTTASTWPLWSWLSARPKSGGSFSRVTCSITRGPENAMSAPGSA